MSKADEALTDVRRWLCDNLSDGDAGKVCGMLSVVSRHINELEAENSKLRGERDHWHVEQVHAYGNWEDANKWASELQAENAKLREAVETAIKVQAVLCGDADSWYCRNKCPLHRPESNDCLACDVIGVAQELGIEVTP